MKILVPLDGSVLSECMLTPALKLGTDLSLVRVLPGLPADHPEGERDAVEAYLEQQRRLLESKGATVRWFLEEGDPAEQILVIAKEQEPDVIAMATHGEAGRTHRVRGSVAERVLRSSHRPILLCTAESVASARENPFQRLLVGLDGSEVADAILPCVSKIALAYQSRVTLLTVFEPGDENDAEQETLEWQRKALEADGIQVDVRAALGQPAEVILEAAGSADLVCLSTHGRSGVSRWWFGSVAEDVIRECRRPLLILRPS